MLRRGLSNGLEVAGVLSVMALEQLQAFAVSVRRSAGGEVARLCGWVTARNARKSFAASREGLGWPLPRLPREGQASGMTESGAAQVRVRLRRAAGCPLMLAAWTVRAPARWSTRNRIHATDQGRIRSPSDPQPAIIFQ